MGSGTNMSAQGRQDACLRRDFPAEIDAILWLCDRDPTMTEICRDYEEIATLIGARETAGAAKPAPTELKETLAGLRIEIIEMLSSQVSD